MCHQRLILALEASGSTGGFHPLGDCWGLVVSIGNRLSILSGGGEVVLQWGEEMAPHPPHAAACVAHDNQDWQCWCSGQESQKTV